MDLESQKGIRHGLQDARRDGLTKYVREFLSISESEGYSLQDLLYALANLTSDQNLHLTTEHLENAAQSVPSGTQE